MSTQTPDPLRQEQFVYLVDGGDYSNYGWDGVYATLEAAIAAHPLPEMRGIPGVQCDPTFARERVGGWQPSDDNEWWNGFSSDFGKRIHRIVLHGALLCVPPQEEPQKDEETKR